MGYEQDAAFLASLLAPVRELAAHAPATLGYYGAKLLHGTTVGALIVGNGQQVVAFSDGRVSMGNKAVSDTYRKIFTLGKYDRLCISGSPILGISYASALRNYFGYKEDTSDAHLTARAKVKTLTKTIFKGISLMGVGIVCSPIYATYDIKEKKCARIWSIGGEGSEVEQTTKGFCASGSGADIDIWLGDPYAAAGGTAMDADTGIALIRKAIAKGADVFSGGHVSIDLIGPDGARTIS